MRVAFIGLGVMGAPMAGHLAVAGHTVSVYNRSPAKAQAWAAAHRPFHLLPPDLSFIAERRRKLISHPVSHIPTR